MQTFKDSASGQVFAFDDDVKVSVTAGVYSFVDKNGAPLQAPKTLAPYVVTAPTSAELLASSQTKQIAILNAACQAQIYAGFTSSALGAAHTYPAKDKDQANLTASYAASFDPTNPAGWTTPFWCMDGTGTWALVQHTAAQIQQVGRDGKAAIIAAITKNNTLAGQVMAAGTVAAVEAIVW